MSWHEAGERSNGNRCTFDTTFLSLRLTLLNLLICMETVQSDLEITPRNARSNNGEKKKREGNKHRKRRKFEREGEREWKLRGMGY